MPIAIPYHDETTTQINKDQRIASKVDINADGLMGMSCEFWNDKQIDGDHYSAQYVAFDANNNPIASCGNVQGLNARFGGKVTYKTGSAQIQISKEDLTKIERVQHHHSQPNSVDDEAVVKDIAEGLKIAYDLLQKSRK